MWIVLVAAFAALAVAWLLRELRRTAGSLEMIAARRGCVYVPISPDLVAQLDEFSRPVQIRATAESHPLLVRLELRTMPEEPPLRLEI